MPRRKTRLGRKQRWKAACSSAQDALTTALLSGDRLASSLTDLVDLQEEYTNRLDSLPPNLRTSKLARQLSAIRDLPIADARDQLQLRLDETEKTLRQVCEMPLPNAFGRN